jgi:ribosome-associated heat shock protein Hsp15
VSEGGTLRLDLWLWYARLAKTRSLAARLCAGGLVAVNGRAVAKANHKVRPGDVVSVPQGRLRHEVAVLALGTRRGPASEARTLYDERRPPEPLGEPAPEWERLLAESAESDAPIGGE